MVCFISCSSCDDSYADGEDSGLPDVTAMDINQETEEDSLGGLPAEYLAQGQSESCCENYLDGAAYKGYAAHFFKFVKGELQPQGEKE